MKTILYFCLLLLFTFQTKAQNIESYSSGDDEFDMFEWDYRNPMIEVNYGISYPKHKNFDGKLSRTGLLEIKLGYSKLSDYNNSSYIKEYSDAVIFLSNRSTEISNNSDEAGKYQSDTWMCGFGNYKGYGYSTGDFSIIPFNGYTFVWNKFNSADLKPGSSNFAPEKPLMRINNSIRFGMATESGIKIQAVDFLSLNTSMETNVVFPRYLIWKHIVSGIIEFGSQGLADEFVDEIMKGSPSAGPVISFILKSGISYGFYKLKQEKMNWPFKTETPLTFETYKIGMTFTF